MPKTKPPTPVCRGDYDRYPHELLAPLAFRASAKHLNQNEFVERAKKAGLYKRLLDLQLWESFNTVEPQS